MKRLFFITGVIVLFFSACSKKNSSSAFIADWNGNYFAGGIFYGTWNITVADNGGITGKIISAPGFPASEFYVTGSVTTNGTVSFTATISSTIQWDFDGTLNNTVADGIWSATPGTLPGNPPDKIWSGNRE